MYHIASSFTRDCNGMYVSGISSTIGEATPLLVIGALAFANYVPFSMFDRFTVLPIQIFNWMSRPQEEFQHVAAAGMICFARVAALYKYICLMVTKSKISWKWMKGEFKW